MKVPSKGFDGFTIIGRGPDGSASVVLEEGTSGWILRVHWDWAPARDARSVLARYIEQYGGRGVNPKSATITLNGVGNTTVAENVARRLLFDLVGDNGPTIWAFTRGTIIDISSEHDERDLLMTPARPLDPARFGGIRSNLILIEEVSSVFCEIGLGGQIAVRVVLSPDVSEEVPTLLAQLIACLPSVT